MSTDTDERIGNAVERAYQALNRARGYRESGNRRMAAYWLGKAIAHRQWAFVLTVA